MKTYLFGRITGVNLFWQWWDTSACRIDKPGRGHSTLQHWTALNIADRNRQRFSFSTGPSIYPFQRTCPYAGAAKPHSATLP